MCGCRKNSSYRSSPALKPAASVRSSSGGIASALTPTQMRAQAQSPTPELNAGGLYAERRKTQAIRRDAIKRALNK